LDLAEQGEFDVIVHGCNCQCQMGGGIALSIRHRFAEAWEADRRTEPGDRTKLGTYSQAAVSRGAVRFVVVNAYTQFHWRGQGVKADYVAIRSVFESVADEFDGQRIGYPLIGAGLAGGDWGVIQPLIDEALAGQRHTLVKYAGA
jgi:O-acetyl-ADP-ribose deacetylase (regulator of RNase III)